MSIPAVQWQPAVTPRNEDRAAAAATPDRAFARILDKRAIDAETSARESDAQSSPDRSVQEPATPSTDGASSGLDNAEEATPDASDASPSDAQAEEAPVELLLEDIVPDTEDADVQLDAQASDPAITGGVMIEAVVAALPAPPPALQVAGVAGTQPNEAAARSTVKAPTEVTKTAAIPQVVEAKPDAETSTGDETSADTQSRDPAGHSTPAHAAASSKVAGPSPEGQLLPSLNEASVQPTTAATFGPSSAVNPASTTAAPSSPPILHASSSMPVVQQPVPQTPEDAANAARVTRGLMNAVQQRGGTVTLRLQPPELGMVRVELQMREGAVQASFLAERESARSLLQTQIGHLRHALETQGLVVERLSVQTMDTQSNNAGGQFTEQGGNEGRSRGGFAQQQGRQSDAEEQQPTAAERRMPSRFEQTLNAVA